MWERAVANAQTASVRGPPGEVFRIFLRLGLTSFGGPIAHLGYYHREFVQRRRWLVEARYAKLLAPRSLCPHHESAVMNSCSRSSLRLELGRNCPSAEPQAAAQAVKAANGEFWWNGAWYLNQPINKDSSGGPLCHRSCRLDSSVIFGA
jgi:hypothetical protein